MTKKIKSILSLLISAAMFIAMLPATTVAAASLTTSMPTTVTVFRNGVTDATANASVLTDGFYYLGDDEITGKSYAFNASKVITFNRETENSGIMWSFDEVTPVRRIDLWLLQIGAIDEYVIETRNSEEESWKTVHTGSLDMYDEFDATLKNSDSYDRFYSDSITNTRASYFPIILPQIENAKEVRFRIVSFPTSINGTEINTAHISEAKIYDTNDINLGYKNSKYKSPYFYSLFMTIGNNKYYSGSTQAIWSSGGLKPSNDKLCYATAFGWSDIQINKIIPKVSSGTVTGIRVYSATDNHLYNGMAVTTNPTKAPRDYLKFNREEKKDINNISPSGTQSWTDEPVAVIACEITEDTPVEKRTFYIPEAIASAGILLEFEYDKNNDTTVVSDIEMYSLSDSELPTQISAARNVFTLLSTDTDVSDKAIAKISGFEKQEITVGSDTYSVKWNDDSALVDEDGNIDFHKDETTVKITATVTDNSTGIAYLVTKLYTLIPRENVGGTTVSDSIEIEDIAGASILRDGFVFSAYDKASSGISDISSAPEKFAKITTENSYIDYIWEVADKVNRIDLWVKEALSIDEYSVQYNDGTSWKILREGKLSDIVTEVENSATATYYPITFEETNVTKLRLTIKSFGEGFTEAYISEAAPIVESSISFAAVPKNATGKYTGYSHYMSSYIVPAISDTNSKYKKSNEAVWPVYDDGTSLSVIPNGSELWYATGFTKTPYNVNRVTVNVLEGTIKEIEVLCAESDTSGFDFSNEYPAAPDTLAPYKTVAVVKGSFNATNPAVIDLPEAPCAKYWMIRVKKPASNTALDRVELSYVYGEQIAETQLAANQFFNDRPSDFITLSEIRLDDTYTYNGKTYSVEWSSSSKLVDVETGTIKEHENDESVTLTVTITEQGGPSVSFVVSKSFVLEGMQSISVVSNDSGSENRRKTTILNDNFTYTNYDSSKLPEPKLACYNLDKFEHFTTVGSAIEYHWEQPRVIARMEMWAWPSDAIATYEIQVSDDGVVWNKHDEGFIEDRYKSAPETRPDNASDEMGKAEFYPIVFESPTAPVKYIRFVITGFRDDSEGAYIAEALFKENNNTNYLGLGTYSSDSKLDCNSIYVGGAYLSHTSSNMTSFNRISATTMWPQYSSGENISLAPRPKKEDTEADVLWYATTIQGPAIGINGASMKIVSGTAYEYEVMCAETGTSGYKWADYPSRPDKNAAWRTVAHVSGPFTKDDVVTINFDNDFKSKYWMIKVTQGSDDLRVSELGLYTFADHELNSSGYANVLDHVFDGVSDTSIDNVIKDKMNLPTTLTIDGVTYETNWTYDMSVIDENGNVIPSKEDRKITLKARIGKPGTEGYMHVRTKDYYIIANDTRAKTTLYSEDNISLTGSQTKTSFIGLEHGFVFSGKTDIEIDFASDNTGGMMKFVNGEDVILTLTVKNGSIIVNEGTKSEYTVSYNEKIKIEFGSDSHNLYSFNGFVYETLAYQKALLKEKSPENIIYTAAPERKLAIDNIRAIVISKDYFDSIEEQFTFEKISPNYRATNLNGDINLFTMLPDITFSYVSGNENVINATTGKVDTSSYQETYITVTANSAAAQDSFTKTFKVFIGKDNLFGKAKSSSAATPVDSNFARYAADGSLETAFIPTSKNYRVDIDLQEIKAIKRMRIITPDTTAKVTEITILASDNNIDFDIIYQGTKINSGEIFEVDFAEARYMSFEIKTDGIGTGITEICAYSDITDEEELEYDLLRYIDSVVVKDGSVIPKEGKFKTSFTLESNSPVVSITETDDKKNWKVVVGSSKSEVTVKITLTALNGTAKAEREYEILVLKDTNIRDNEISGGGNAGSGGGGGGGGGSSAPSVNAPSISGGVATIPDSETTPSLSSKPDELNNHWGAEEIKNLIFKGIVEGDGNSLSLDRSVTRAEFCKMIIASLGIEVSGYNGIYADISSGDWFAPYAQAAKDYSIMSGDSTGFRGNDVISRQEMAVVLLNALKSYLPEFSTEKELAFSDNDSIAYWAKDAVRVASGLELLKGYDTGDFKPGNNLRRDEAMVVVYRLLTYLGK